MRINKFVASATGLSRRNADEAIEAGRVLVNTELAQTGQVIDPVNDVITLDDTLIKIKPHKYIALNKPVGYVCSRASQGGEPTIYELLPPELKQLKTAGRLDRDSSGLVLLSDDGDFIHQLSHPSNNKIKTYEVELNRPLVEDEIRILATGVDIGDSRLSALQVSSIEGNKYHVELGEGRNRQIRRSFSAIGAEVINLRRTKMGPYKLESLTSGGWTEIFPDSQQG